MSKLLLLFVVITLSVAATRSSTADVREEGSTSNAMCSPNTNFVCVTIDNIVSKADSRRLREIIAAKQGRMDERLGPVRIYATLDSPGGDLAASLSLGRLLRAHQAIAIVQPRAQCASACVFVLIGAVDRSAYGKIGIHRPYSTSTDSIPIEQRERLHRAIHNAIAAYLDEMNVSPELLTAMERVPPEKIRFLSARHIHEYGLDERDPAEEEDENAAEARAYGLSMQEYLRRKSRAETVCPNGMTLEQARANFSCTQEVMAGRR
ncbi:MAG: COG3904 family protein [Gammaproteobacteria bacterium]